MASGHVNRTSRPNTWQHRPSLRREDSSCQPGAVHTWHLADMAGRALDVRCSGGTIADNGVLVSRLDRCRRDGRPLQPPLGLLHLANNEPTPTDTASV